MRRRLLPRSFPGEAIGVAARHPSHYTMPRCSVARHARRRFRGESPMPSPAFYATDFKVFDEQGFRARMGAIRERIRPKLEAVGPRLPPAVPPPPPAAPPPPPPPHPPPA